MSTKRWMLGAALALAGCGDATLSVAEPTEHELLAKTQRELGSRIEQHFGADARLERVVPQGDSLLVGVATRPAPVDADGVPAVAFAIYQPRADAFEVVAKEQRFHEAKLTPAGVALVSDEGAFILQSATEQRVLAEGVRGDVAASPSGDAFAMTLLGQTRADGETKVALVAADGELKVLADAEGVDDRPAISPDGKTVVFVSGRTGIASFFRTTLDGAEPVQLTNVGLEPGTATDGALPGFVPPPVNTERLQWLDEDTLRYDAGGDDFWTLNVRTGAAVQLGGGR